MKNRSFDASSVELTGTNLIEASAGTGKTYSIAIMVLRLVLEENMSIREILMVTFTKAAVAELEERIRSFIRMAHRRAHDGSITDSTIEAIVTKSINKITAKKVQDRLQEAVLFLDETAVMTIHGFCQQTLTEFAFETGQVFGAETLQDPSMLLQDQVNRFWRKQVTTMPTPLLAALIKAGLTRAKLLNVVGEHLGGKRYFPYEEGVVYNCNGDQHAQWMRELEELQEKENNLENSVLQFITSNRDRLLALSNGNGFARKALSHLIDEPDQWLKVVRGKIKEETQYVLKLYPDIIQLCSDCETAASEVEQQCLKILSHLYCVAISQISQALTEVKERKNLIAFDDMIAKVHSAIAGRSNSRLIDGLRQKYKAVFVDEFQDTDRLQYEIFEAAFASNTIVFYIGDPKQSIYAWRKADLHTYFRARNAVGNVYDMNINFRSSAAYIAAMNEFFNVDDPFFYGVQPDGISYIDVESPAESAKGILLQEGAASTPISIIDSSAKPALRSALAADVIRLLDPSIFKLQVKDETRPVRPSDIGILVRSNRDAAEIKADLAAFGIAAVTIGDAKVLESDEAVMVWHLLVAMEEPVLGNINRALISPLTGYDSDSVLHLKEEVVTDMFRNFRKAWEESGVYTAMMNLVAAFNIRGKLLSGDSRSGERTITNLFQLIELLHKVQVRQNLSTLELIAWLKRGIDGMVTEGDEFEQRVESDDDSIKIVTIHKSKGLEYNIVLCPGLDQVDINEREMVSFRQPDPGNDYVSVESKSLTDEQRALLVEQSTQEKRRMIYVALTRAVYKTFLYRNRGSKIAPASALNHFIDGRIFSQSGLIDRPMASVEPAGYRFQRHSGALGVPRVASLFKLEHTNWRKVSYSSLAAKHEFQVKPTLGGNTDVYDKFMFYQLPKGAHTGNMLHYIFEQVNFSSESNWSYVIDKAITQFAPGKRELYGPLLRRLLETVMSAPLRIGDESFRLSDIDSSQRVSEFEFDYSIAGLQPSVLNALSDNSISIAVKEQSQLEGLMNGLIDLLFCHKGKYYILDWKSNYLGDRLDNYTHDRLAEAMNESNYHLQYLVYSVAARRYLQTRLGSEFNFETDFGGVIYLFVRGIRPNHSNGIYTTIPPVGLIEQLEEQLSANLIVHA